MDTERVSDERLVDLLREYADHQVDPVCDLMKEAADKLERLQSRRAAQPAGEVERLEKALEQAAVHLEIAAATLSKAGRPAAASSALSDAQEARTALNQEGPAQPAGEVERLREALNKAAEQFELYAQEHRQKVRNQMFNGLPVLAEAAAQKAETNEKFAAICRAALNHPGRVKP